MVGGVEGTDGGTYEVEAGGSSVCSSIGDRSPNGLSVVGSSSSGLGGGR